MLVLDDLPPCAVPETCSVAYLFEPLTPETLARMRREWNTNPTVDRVLRWLSTDWTTSTVLARRLGLPRAAVLARLDYARSRGAPIEARQQHGYRLRVEAAS